MHNVVLSPIAPEELIKSISDRVTENILERLRAEPRQEAQSEEGLMTREEVLSYLQISSTTLWRYEKEGRLKSYSVCGKRYYKKPEIEASLIQKK